MDEDLILQDGSMLEDMRRRGKLRRHQIVAWQKWNCLISAHGSTNGMVSSYEEQVDKSGPGAADAYMFESRAALERAIVKSHPYIYITPAGVEFQAVWGYLRREERGLIEQITRDYHRASGNRDINAPTIAALGFVLSGYHDNRQQIAAGVTAVQRLLNSVAEFYGLPSFIP